MMDPEQRDAIMAFWEAAFAVLGTVTADAVQWSDSDEAKKGNPWATIHEITASTIGIPQEAARDDMGTPTLVTREMQEVVYEIQVGARQGDNPTHAGRAQHLLNCARIELYRGRAVIPIEAVGVSVMRVNDLIDLSALANDSQWETRASFTVVFNRASVIKDTTTSTIESVEVTGTLSPVPGTVGPEVIGP